MNRRTLLQGFAAGVAGLLVPTGIAENAEAVTRASLRAKIAAGLEEYAEVERRYWPGYGAGRWSNDHIVSAYEFQPMYLDLNRDLDWSPTDIEGLVYWWTANPYPTGTVLLSRPLSHFRP